MYSVYEYGNMITDRPRIDVYAAALRACVTPASVVLDIGAGPGILTLLACQAGARKVYAIEPDPIVDLARDAVAANGFADRVEIVDRLSTAIDLPEPVDVIVSDLRGVLPPFFSSLASLLDARVRFLKPGGCMIPSKDTIWAALVTAADRHRSLVEPWDNHGGLQTPAARSRAVNSWIRWHTDPASLVVEPQVWATIDYAVFEDVHVAGELRWTIERAADVHGLCLWFDCETSPGCGFSNGPGSGRDRIYQQAFFPWPEACPLEPGDEVVVAIRADPVGDDYTWSWNADIVRPARPDGRTAFRQSQFLAAAIAPERLRKTASDFVPALTADASIDRMVLDLFFAGVALGEIATRVSAQFPERFPEWRDALTRVGDLSMRYSR